MYTLEIDEVNLKAVGWHLARYIKNKGDNPQHKYQQGAKVDQTSTLSVQTKI